MGRRAMLSESTWCGALLLGLGAAVMSGCTGTAASSQSESSSPAGSVSSSSSGPSTALSASSAVATPTLTPTATATPNATPTPTTTSKPTTKPTPKRTAKKYGFGLPSGPATPGPELLVYEPLRIGDCHGAQTALGEPDQDGQWRSLPDPSKVLLFQAGIAACGGDMKKANSWLALDRTLFKATTAEDPQAADAACSLYRALVSVLSQVAPDTVKCPTGPQPAWFPPDGDPLDPRSHQDSYAHPPPASSGGAPPPASSPAVTPAPSATS